VAEDHPAGPVAQIRTPEAWTKGAYANGVAVWFSPHEFTIDFVVSLPPEVGSDDAGKQVAIMPQEVVARVKIPPPLVFQLMRNLYATMERYEQQHGSIPEFGGGHAEPGAPEGG
jgi:hypothetical protein